MMSLDHDFISLIRKIEHKRSIPKIRKVFFPQKNKDYEGSHAKQNNFLAIELESGDIGVAYINLTPELFAEGINFDSHQMIGEEVFKYALRFDSSSIFEKTIALGAINAISQYIFSRSRFPLDESTDSLGLLALNSADTFGMVGFFPPLVKIVNDQNIKMWVIEKKEELLQSGKTWQVSMDPSHLQECNKILITSTTIINNSLDDILSNCTNAESISIIGPSAGFLPDVLFERGINVVGGTRVVDSALFLSRMEANMRWGASTQKYCIIDDTYPGIDSLLERIQ